MSKKKQAETEQTVPYTIGKTFELAIEKIHVDSVRQRSDCADTTDLEESIEANGLLQPIVITPEGKLLAGWRRLTAYQRLGRDTIEVKVIGAVGLFEGIIEYAENAHRKNLTWQEESVTVRRLHDKLTALYPEWSQEKTAAMLGRTVSNLGRLIITADFVEQNPEIAAKITHRDAFARVTSAAKRKQEEILQDIHEDFLGGQKKNPMPKEETSPEEEPKAETHEESVDENTKQIADEALPVEEVKFEPKVPAKVKPLIEENWELLHGNCYDLAEELHGGYNFLHLDPPYGVDVNRSESMLSKRSGVEGEYEDSPELFREALDFWIANPPECLNQNFCTAVVWHTPEALTLVKEAAIAGDWDYMRFPFIWHKTDNKGTIPNPARDFRRTYEQALFLYKGSKVVQNVAASFGSPSKNLGIHTTEKPLPVLRHIFRGLLFRKARVLDPFAGSANALKALTDFEDLVEVVTGIELDKRFYNAALESTKKAYALARSSRAVSALQEKATAQAAVEEAEKDDLANLDIDF